MRSPPFQRGIIDVYKRQAYSKAWSILKHAEESFDIQLLRRKGNKGSELTPEARRLIAIYEELQKQLDEQAASLLDELLR